MISVSYLDFAEHDVYSELKKRYRDFCSKDSSSNKITFTQFVDSIIIIKLRELLK